MKLIVLGILRMPGLTAYFGFLDICQPKRGETLVVSAASGAVGSVVGQLAKLKGCHVIGISGSDQNAKQLKELGFDEIINYKLYHNDMEQLKQAILKACPNQTGVDMYYDNTGGWIMDAVTLAMNHNGRICFCGAISQYNKQADVKGQQDMGPHLSFIYVTRELKMQGFVVGSFSDRFEEATKQLSDWVLEGKLKVLETREKGIEHIPNAIAKLFTGEKIGKMIVDC